MNTNLVNFLLALFHVELPARLTLMRANIKITDCYIIGM